MNARSFQKMGACSKLNKNIRIHHESEGRIEKFVPRITFWHHKACRVMTNGDHEGRIFLSKLNKNIRIHHECEGRIEKSVPRIAVWHHEACQAMTNDDHEGQIFY